MTLKYPKNREKFKLRDEVLSPCFALHLSSTRGQCRMLAAESRDITL